MDNKRVPTQLHIVIYSKLEKHGGGRETWADYFLKALTEMDEFKSINIYCLGSENDSNTLIEEFQNYKNIQFFPVQVQKFKSSFLRMIKFARDTKVNILYKSNSGEVVLFLGAMMEGIAALYLSQTKKCKLKSVLWIRSIGLKELSTRRNSATVLLLSLTEKMVFNTASAIIFNGKDTFEFYKTNYEKLTDKMHVVENAVDYAMFSRVRPVQFIDKTINIAYIGRFNKEKGFFDFLNSINLYNSQVANEDRDNIRFQIWGFGMEFTLPRNAVYHGILNRKDILEVLRNNHIIVFLNLAGSNLAAGLSHGLLEALAGGRVCLAYDNPAHNQVLNDANSILIPEGDVETLTRTYLEISENVTNNSTMKLEKIARSGLKTAEKFSIESHINKFMKIYHNVLDEQH